MNDLHILIEDFIQILKLSTKDNYFIKRIRCDLLIKVKKKSNQFIPSNNDCRFVL